MKNDNIDYWLNTFFAILAILAIKSIFENDNSKIISNKGKAILEDDEKMRDVYNQINNADINESHTYIVIN